MEPDVIVRRRAEREALIDVARRYVRELAERVSLRAAYLAGSVARGDFNVWSDIDVVVVADELPIRLPDRLAVLMARAPPRIQAVGFTPAEFETAKTKNHLVIEALALGVPLVSERRLT